MYLPFSPNKEKLTIYLTVFLLLDYSKIFLLKVHALKIHMIIERDNQLKLKMSN
jgi:hypothetical protein